MMLPCQRRDEDHTHFLFINKLLQLVKLQKGIWVQRGVDHACILPEFDGFEGLDLFRFFALNLLVKEGIVVVKEREAVPHEKQGLRIGRTEMTF